MKTISSLSLLSLMFILLFSRDIHAQDFSSILNDDQIAQLMMQGDSGTTNQFDRNESSDSITRNEYNNAVKQIKRVDEGLMYEKFQDELNAKRIELATKLCIEDENACYLIENYSNYKSEKQPSEGEELEIFGSDLFSSYPLNFEQSIASGIPESYLIRVGDVIKVNIFGPKNIRSEVEVDSSGVLVIRDIGAVQIGGLSLKDAQLKVDEFAKQLFPGSSSYISLLLIHPINVYVLGAVKNPGSYKLNGISKAVNAIIASGGFISSSSLRNIKIIRNDKDIANLDLYDFLITGKTTSDLFLQDGDVVFIEPTKNKVEIDGAVNRPGIYEFKAGETLSDLMNFALGTKEFANNESISLERFNNLAESTVLSVNIEDQIELKLNDKFFVNTLEGDRSGFIELRGDIRVAGFYSSSGKSKLKDIFNKDTDLTKTTYLPYVLIKRFNPNTRSYQFFSFSLESDLSLNSIDLFDRDVFYFFSNEDIQFINSNLIKNFVNSSSKDFYTNYFYELIDEELEFTSITLEQMFDDDRFSCLMPLKLFSNSDFDLMLEDKVNLNSGIKGNFCTDFFNINSDILPIVINDSIPVVGSLLNPGIYPSSPSTRMSVLLDYAGKKSSADSVTYEAGVDNNSKFISGSFEEISNQTNLSFVLSKDIFESKNQSFVTLVGEFKYPGVYPINSNTTISELYERAGGTTDNAFPIGAIFTRTSVLEREEAALERAQAEIGSILASAVTSGMLEKSSTDLIGLLKLMNEISVVEPIGRLVAELDPYQIRKNPSLDILLENRDTIYMPKITSTVTIQGNVLNPVTVPYELNSSIRDYINLAGGYQDTADRDKVYVLLPNGKAIPGSSFNLFGYNKDDIYPGSTIIVPQKARPLSGLSLVEALSPILANLSITLASINSISNN